MESYCSYGRHWAVASSMRFCPYGQYSICPVLFQSVQTSDAVGPTELKTIHACSERDSDRFKITSPLCRSVALNISL